MSVNGAAGANNSPVTGQVAALSRDVFAGLITSIVAVAYGLSFAALIFAPPLTPWIAYGIAATFLTTAISAAIIAARSSLPFAIAGPDGATARSRQPWWRISSGSREPAAPSGAAQLCGHGDDRALELRQQGDRRAAPLAQSSPGVKRLDAPDVGCFVASTIEFVLLLEVQPEFWGGSERLSEA